jgi:hypothetical protein
MPSADTDPEIQAHAKAFREALDSLGWTEGKNIPVRVSLDARRQHAGAGLRQGAGRSVARRHPHSEYSTGARTSRRNPNHPHRFWLCLGSGRIQAGRQSRQAWRQYHRLHQHRSGVRAAMLVNPANPYTEPEMRETSAAARLLDIQVQFLNATSEREIDDVLAHLSTRNSDGLLLGADLFFFNRRSQLAEIARRKSLPAVYAYRESPRSADCSAMVQATRRVIANLASMRGVSSKERNRPICP